MSLLVKAGITRLSELTIDADKDWLVKGISNIREVAAAMTQGDMILSNGGVIDALNPGPISTVLTTQGLGNPPIWGHP